MAHGITSKTLAPHIVCTREEEVRMLAAAAAAQSIELVCNYWLINAFRSRAV